MTEFRTEKDLLGERQVPAGALHGIHTERALENFPLALRRVNPALIRAYGAVKLACARTNHELGWWDDAKARAIEQACSEMMEGQLDGHIVVDALQGGAGTSTNMNVNEVLANRALQLLGRPLGDYAAVSPLEDINLHQSTNDTYPTALKVAAIQLLRALEREVTAPLRGIPAEGKGVRARRQGRPDGDAGRRAGDARARDVGLRRGVRARPLAHLQMRGAPARDQPRRHGGRHGPAGAARVHLPRRRAPARHHRPGVRPRGEPGRGHAERRRVRRGQRHPQGVRRRTCSRSRRTSGCSPPGRTRGSASCASPSGRPAPRSCPERSTRSSRRRSRRRRWR